MREVSKEHFYGSVGQLDVVPRSERDATYWETRSRELLGKSMPGYLGVGEKKYFVADRFA